MSYRVGVDLGTTYSSAAVAREGRAQIVPLGNRAAVVPSVVLARDDGSLVTGEAAEARAATEPGRVAREFKRRLGDPSPIRLGSVELSADALMAAMLPPILETVAAREGGPPDTVAITHPANWGPARRDLLLEALEAHPLPPITMLTEPEAAAIHYAATEHIDPGEIVAVYDLGGGTFDAALLRRRTPAEGEVDDGSPGFEVIGRPEGIDRLGGVDFDAAVLAHVNRFLGGALDTLDLDDPAVAAGMARLRADCVEAKEVLSTDTDVEIPVLLPGLRTEVRMTRGELEAMIRPALGDTIGALRRAMGSAAVLPEEITAVLLVGGSSRIPLVARLVGAELARPVAVDVHPKHAVALGAALAAAIPSQRAGADSPGSAAAAGAAGVAGIAGAAGVTDIAAAVDAPSPAPTAAAIPPTVATPGTAEEAAAAAAVPPGGPGDVPTGPPAPPDATGTGPTQPEPAGSGRSGRRSSRIALLVGILILVVGVIVGGVLLAGGGDDEPPAEAAGASTTATPATTSAATAPATTAASAPTSAPTTAPTTTPVTAAPATTTTAARCETTATPFVCITSVGVDGAQNLVIPFEARGFVPLIGPAPNRHIHFYFPVGSMAANPANAGTSGPSPGDWVLWDQPNPFGPGGSIAPYTVADAKRVSARSICVLVADAAHAVTPGTGNCLDLPPAVTGSGG